MFSIALADVFALPKMIVTIGLAVALALLLVTRALASRPGLRRDPLWIALLAFLGWAVIATFASFDQQQAVVGERLQYQGLAAWIAYAVFLVGARTTVRGAARRRGLVVGSIAGAVIVTAYALVQRAGLDPIWHTLRLDRVFSTIGQANALGAYLVLVVPFIVVLAATPLGWLRAISVALLGSVLLALAYTLSRGGWIGAAVEAAVLLVVLRPRRLAVSRRNLAMAALAVLLVIGPIGAIPAARDTAAQFATRALSAVDLRDGSIKGHLDLWAVGAAIVADHPIIGTGPDTYVLLFARYRDDVLLPARAEHMRRFRPESPHDVYLAVAGGAGLPALAAYAAVVAIVIVRLVAVVRTAAGRGVRLFAAAALAAIAGHLVTDAFMTAEVSGSLIFWITLGAGAALADDSAVQVAVAASRQHEARAQTER